MNPLLLTLKIWWI